MKIKPEVEEVLEEWGFKRNNTKTWFLDATVFALLITKWELQGSPEDVEKLLIAKIKSGLRPREWK